MTIVVYVPSYNWLCVACPLPDTYQDEKKVHLSILARKKQEKGSEVFHWFVPNFLDSPTHYKYS